MDVVVLYFAAARERAGQSREVFSVPEGATVKSLLEQVCHRHPPLSELLPHLRVAVNEAFVPVEQSLVELAQVALIPPVAGGAPRYRLTPMPLQLDEVVRAVQGEEHGGLVTFTGVVRNHTQQRRVLKLEYEAYVPMAEKKLAEIGEEISVKWPGVRTAIVHRVGTLLPGEAAVVLAASGVHRQEAFSACEYAIFRLKQDVPIWKKEHFEGGDVWVGLGP